jgi:eukaryotic-like serine/threonine-protein kinase
MSFLQKIKADRLISEVKASEEDPVKFQKALQKLIQAGPGGIPGIFDAIGSASRQEWAGYIAVLTALLNKDSFPRIAEGLTNDHQRVVDSVVRVLSNGRNFPVELLYSLFDNPEVPKPALVSILSAHKPRLNARTLLNRAIQQEPAEKAALFRIITELADSSLAPLLIEQLGNADPLTKTHLIHALARFNQPEIAKILEAQLKDTNKYVRQAVLTVLARFGEHTNVGTLCEILRDPDMETQQRAIDTIVRARHPDTILYLVQLLRDENEGTRRAAVEVLNEIGSPEHIKYLLQSIKDEDWWVRSRTADALAKIGGPWVTEAALQLIRDKDEGVRRAAIEILNQTKDPRAVEFLIEATRDKDWWVRERAVDALSEMGGEKVLTALIKLLQETEPRSLPVVIKALGKLGNPKAIEHLAPFLNDKQKEARIEAINALTRLADDGIANDLRTRFEVVAAQANDPEVAQAAKSAAEELGARYSTEALKMTSPERTLLVERPNLDDIAKQDAGDVLDINTLESGQQLDGRYKFIQKIGKGAFGTVLLVEDLMVNENLILKFLNPSVAQDEETMQRFVHELRYSRKITHPNVIRIYDFLLIKGNHAISMEYFPSHMLGHEIDGKPMSIKKAVRFACDIATGMTVAHKAGIVHRDLKPANVLVNDEGIVKVVDFGVAAARQGTGETQLTKTGYIVGSPKYMAPEQILGTEGRRASGHLRTGRHHL